MSEEKMLTEIMDPKTGEIKEIPPTPEDLLLAAAEAAKALERVITLNDRPPLMFNGKRYLEVHHWQVLGKFYHCTVSTSDPEFIEIDGVKGFKAKAVVLDERNGIVVGGAEAFCMRDEGNWKSKPLYSLASMAQTRAMSKALSNKFRFVAVVAGYEGTPSEEIQDAGLQPQRQVAMPRAKAKPAQLDMHAVGEQAVEATVVQNPPNHEPGPPGDASGFPVEPSSKFFDQLHKIAREKNVPPEKMKKAIKTFFNRDSSKELVDAEVVQLIKMIQSGGIK